MHYFQNFRVDFNNKYALYRQSREKKAPLNRQFSIRIHGQIYGFDDFLFSRQNHVRNIALSHFSNRELYVCNGMPRMRLKFNSNAQLLRVVGSSTKAKANISLSEPAARCTS